MYFSTSSMSRVKYIGGFPIYGYQKDPADKNHIIPDPEAAEVVRQIYQWSLEGHGRQNIAYALHQPGQQMGLAGAVRPGPQLQAPLDRLETGWRASSARGSLWS